MMTIIKCRTRLPGKAVKALTLETLKTCCKHLRNGLGKVGHALSHGYRDWRTSRDAFQTLLCNFCATRGVQQSDILNWTKTIVLWDGPPCEMQFSSSLLWVRSTELLLVNEVGREELSTERKTKCC